MMERLQKRPPLPEMAATEQGSQIFHASPCVPQAPLEIWGGAEYTHNRVHDEYLDQMDVSGHATRMDDYDRIAELGISTVRLGLLWEHHVRDGSWEPFDDRLTYVKRAGLRPIAGLLHHGSGPRNTSLLDPEFPEKLAAYAQSVAERYPWIDLYTPVNEPHTTARFSCMYGIWYPHHRSRSTYLRVLLNQLKGVVLSIAAVRRVNSGAHLVQTDDIGRISGTDKLQPLWSAMNARQWLPFDLLCGRVDRHHPMFAYLRAEQLTEAEILWFAEHACPPDVIGINYYPTSDRFLDHRPELYPSGHISSEGHFIDVEAVRVDSDGLAGIASLITETWERYRIPTAVTEVHLGGRCDEQIRWLADIWSGVQRARESGASCIALTIWAVFGSFYWNQLVTCSNGHYEPGAYDVRGPVPEMTELAAVVQQLARGESPSHPALSEPGWWQSDSRVLYPFSTCVQTAA